jgi:malonate transporter MadM subunit
MMNLQENISQVLTGNGLITAFLFSGIVLFLANQISEKLTRGRIHSSAVAIFLGLAAAYIGGLIAGGEKGLADIAVFSGLSFLGGSMLRNFTIVASSYGAKLSEVKKAGPVGFLSLFVGIASSYTMGAVVAVAFGYRDAVSVATIAAGAVTFVVGPVTGQTLGADSTVIALSVAAGLIKTIFIMILTPFIAKPVGITNPKMAMIYGGLVGSTSGVSTGLAATDPTLVPYGTMVATFYSGFGCLLAPSLLHGITKLIFPA